MTIAGSRSFAKQQQGQATTVPEADHSIDPDEPRAEPSSTKGQRKLLVIDTAYTPRMMADRGLFGLVMGRDLNGHFNHVWSCHPFAAVIDDEGSPDRFGPARSHSLGSAHTLIEGSGARFHWLGSFPRINFLASQIGLIVRLLRLVQQEGIDFVRAESALYDGLLAWLVARLSRRPLIIAMWGNHGEIRKSTGRPLMPRLFRTVAMEERVERFVLRRADLALAQNEDNRSFVLRSGVPYERTALFRTGNALEPAHFSDPASRDDGRADLRTLGLADEQVLLVISRLEKLKLVDHVLLALAELKQRGLRPVTLFAGDGPFRAEMEALATRLDVADQVRFLGNQPQDWFVRVLPSVSVVVSPLTGRALAEAALAGAPVVAYDIDWHSELISSGKTGELVPHLDHVALADGIERLLADPARARTMGNRLREKAHALLDPAEANRAQIAAYESLIDCR